jgi:hypothetical protein
MNALCATLRPVGSHTKRNAKLEADVNQQEEWIEAMKAKGHSPKMNEDGSLDIFAHDADTHNGPGCTACGWRCCWHCDKPKDIPACHPGG